MALKPELVAGHATDKSNTTGFHITADFLAFHLQEWLATKAILLLVLFGSGLFRFI